MFKHAFTLAAALFVANVAIASPTKTAVKAPAKAAKTAKITDINYCPMMGGKVEGKGSGSQVVGNKRLHFCCAGCQPEFNKLSKAEQAKKVAEALKTQQDAAKKTVKKS